MPIERFTDDGDEAAPAEKEAATDEAVSNTGTWGRLLKRLSIPAGAGIGLGVVILACFLLFRGGGALGIGASGEHKTLVVLEPQTINLLEPGTRLEVCLVFEASSPELGAVLLERRAQLADMVIAVVSTKKIDEIDSELKRNRLKRELADAVGQRLRANEAYVTNVYYTQFYYRSQ